MMHTFFGGSQAPLSYTVFGEAEIMVDDVGGGGRKEGDAINDERLIRLFFD